MAFRYDARAVLARIAGDAAPDPVPPAGPAATPTAPPAAGRTGPVGSERVALCPDLDAFEERAGIVQCDSGVGRDKAEALAAAALGFPDPQALHDAAVEGWTRDLDRPQARARDIRAAAQIAAARRFPAEGWGARALTLGWTETDLLGLCPRAPRDRLDRTGVAWFAHPVIAMTDAPATHRAPDGRHQTRMAHRQQPRRRREAAMDVDR